MTAQPAAVAAAPAGRGQLLDRMRADTTLQVGLVLVGLVVGAALVSFVWTPHDPYLITGRNTLSGPTMTNWMGTDAFGRDVLSRLMVGARTTLFVGALSVTLAAGLGTPLGVVMGMVSHRPRSVLTSANDLLLSFPALLLAIMFTAAWGGSTTTAMTAIGLATVPVFARVAMAGTRQVMSSDYILAARAAGRSRPAMALRHVLPNIASLLLVQASVSFAIAVLAEAALSYLGLGTPPPIPSWGRMLFEAQNVLPVAPAQVLWPGLGIAVAVLGFNLLGDGMRDVLDPRLAQRL